MKLLGRDDWDDFSAHSMRSGFASVAAENGASIQAIKGQGGWKSDRTAMRYIRRREGWETTAASKLGL
jgi:integrase